MNNGGIDPNDGNNNNDYGNEEDGYEGMGDNGMDPNNDGAGGDNGNNENEDVDQYFDDAGDIGYLPADHVRISIGYNNV